MRHRLEKNTRRTICLTMLRLIGKQKLSSVMERSCDGNDSHFFTHNRQNSTMFLLIMQHLWPNRDGGGWQWNMCSTGADCHKAIRASHKRHYGSMQMCMLLEHQGEVQGFPMHSGATGRSQWQRSGGGGGRKGRTGLGRTKQNGMASWQFQEGQESLTRQREGQSRGVGLATFTTGSYLPCLCGWTQRCSYLRWQNSQCRHKENHWKVPLRTLLQLSQDVAVPSWLLLHPQRPGLGCPDAIQPTFQYLGKGNAALW